MSPVAGTKPISKSHKPTSNKWAVVLSSIENRDTFTLKIFSQVPEALVLRMTPSFKKTF